MREKHAARVCVKRHTYLFAFEREEVLERGGLARGDLELLAQRPQTVQLRTERERE
jgi:hypothetical protein